MAKNRKVTYRLNRMYGWALENRMSPDPRAFKVIKTRWLYNHGDRNEHTEKCIYKLYDDLKGELS